MLSDLTGNIDIFGLMLQNAWLSAKCRHLIKQCWMINREWSSPSNKLTSTYYVHRNSWWNFSHITTNYDFPTLYYTYIWENYIHRHSLLLPSGGLEQHINFYSGGPFISFLPLYQLISLIINLFLQTRVRKSCLETIIFQKTV